MWVSDPRRATKTVKGDSEELTHEYVLIELEHDLYENNTAVFPIPPKKMIDLETDIEGQAVSIGSILNGYNLRDVGKPKRKVERSKPTKGEYEFSMIL